MQSAVTTVNAGLESAWMGVPIHFEQPWFVLNAAEQYNLAVSGDAAISHFYSFEAGPLEQLTFAIPDGCVDLMFDCDDSNPAAKICGSTLEARNAGLRERHRYFGVRFAVGVLPEFVNVAANELVNHEFDLLDLVPEFEAVFTAILRQTEFLHQVSLFRDFYQPLAQARPSMLTAGVVRFISEQKGRVKLRQLEALTGSTLRTVQRQFKAEMGMSPKVFSRIVRCQSAIERIHRPGDMASSELACDLGFSDQSHFSREFKRFVSTTPSDYQRRVRQSAYFQRIRLS